MQNNLKNLRTASKLTQKEVAKLIDKDETLVSMHESGTRNLTQNDILAYAKIFKVQTHELFIVND